MHFQFLLRDEALMNLVWIRVHHEFYGNSIPELINNKDQVQTVKTGVPKSLAN